MASGSAVEMNLAQRIVLELTDDLDAPLPTLAEVERALVTVAIARHGMRDAGRALGIGKTTIYRKALEYRIPHQSHGSSARALAAPARKWIERARIEALVRESRRAADYLLRCVGHAHMLGQALGCELQKLEAPR
jgi:hypothetical protein